MNPTRIRTWAFVSVIALTLFYAFGLYQKALFFTPVQLYVTSGLTLFGFVTSIALGGWRLKMPVWLIFAFGYGVFTWLTTLWAANAQLAVEGAVTVTASILLAVIGTVLPTWSRKYLLHLLAVAGPVVYLFGLGTVLKLWSYVSATMADAQGNTEMNSVFQYHNTFGAFELATFAIAIGLSDLAKQWWQRAIYIALAGFSVLGVISSYSREVWILLPVVAVLMILLQLLRKRSVRTLLTTAYAIIASVAGAVFAIPALSHASKHDALYMFVLVVVVAAIMALIDVGFPRVLRTRNARVAALSALGIVVIAVVVFLVHHEAHKLASITSRVSSIKLKDFSVEQRILFYQAGLRMWSHNALNLLLGAGWAAWAAKFLAFQQYPYQTTQAHSYVVETLINGGLVGFLLWLTTLVLVIVSAIRFIRRGSAVESALAITALVGAITMLLHGAFDFDFSFALIISTFFLLLGLGAKPQAPMEDEDDKPRIRWTANAAQGDEGQAPKWVRVASPVMNIFMGAGACVAVIMGGMLSAAEHLYTRATTTDASNSYSAHAELTKATQWAPYYADPYAQIVQLDMSQLQQDETAKQPNTSTIQQDAATAWKDAQVAAAKDPWNPKTQSTMSMVAYQVGQDTAAYQLAKRAAYDSPFHAEYPTTFMGIGLWTTLIQQKQLSKAEITNRFQEILHQLRFAEASVAAQQKMTFGYQPSWSYSVTAPMQVYGATADYALGNYQASLKDMSSLSTSGQDANTQALKDIVTLLDNRQLKPGYTNDKIMKEIQANPTYQQEYQLLQALHPAKKGK